MAVAYFVFRLETIWGYKKRGINSHFWVNYIFKINPLNLCHKCCYCHRTTVVFFPSFFPSTVHYFTSLTRCHVSHFSSCPALPKSSFALVCSQTHFSLFPSRLHITLCQNWKLIHLLQNHSFSSRSLALRKTRGREKAWQFQTGDQSLHIHTISSPYNLSVTGRPK